jgi:hypothetical protein
MTNMHDPSANDIFSDKNRNVTYLLLLYSRDLLQKLSSSQLVKEFLAFYGTQRFITVSTSARHLSLSYTRSIEPMPPHPHPEDPS